MTAVDTVVDTAALAAAAHSSAAEVHDDPRGADDLRTRVLWNLGAALGAQDITGPVERALTGADPGSWAFRTATRMHARTQDDFLPAGRVHIGAVVLPAVLAIGAGDPLPALAAGYRVMCAVSAAYAADAQRTGLRPTGVFGPMGAAAAAAVASGADEAATAHAIGIAAALSGGTNQAWADGSDEWVLQVGTAARTGVEAALLAAHGTRSARRAVQGPHGWAAAFFADPGAGRLADLLVRTPPPAEVAIKPYPVSGIAQVPSLLAARAREAGWAGQPTPVELYVSEAELAYPGSRNAGPFSSRADSLMSLVRCTAHVLVHGRITFDGLSAVPGPAEQAWIEQVQVQADPDLEDGHARLRVGDHEVAGDEHEQLYPTWAATSSDLDLAGQRLECAPTRLAEVADHLATSPDTRTLREMVER